MCRINNQGYTLLEITLVVAILGIVAVGVIPDLSSGSPIKLDLAAEEVAEAARFARAEAIRTGTPHGMNTSTSSDRIRVYSLPTLVPSYDVRHPIDKKLYDIQFTSDSRMAGVDLVSASFDFDGISSSSTDLSFSSEGIPKYTSAGTDYMLTSATITLSYGNDQRLISIAPMTGRVSIQ